jgi:eukaryotic-like serine/threonine-protein kinase
MAHAHPSQGGTPPRLLGRYALFDEIASGGMATVHLGRLTGAVGFSRTVAIKRLHPQFAKDPEFVSMFLDEARLAGRIRHPNAVSTLDVLSLENELFLVMEYVHGESLAKLARVAAAKGMPVPAGIAAAVLSNTLQGLHAAHEAKDEHGVPLGIVHRDVSPQNVLVGLDGTARVLDFGVAKAAGRLQTTREGQVKGKLAYMAPEQLSGGHVTRQTDVYAAGVVLWELLSGRRLFEGDNEAMLLMRVLEGRYPLVSQLRPDLAAGIDQVIAGALAKDPQHRFKTAREFGVAVERCLGMSSPTLVSEWVEHVCGAEMARRTALVAAIESSSVTSAAMPFGQHEPVAPPSSSHIAAAPASNPGRPRDDLTSQVSSISVARSATRRPEAPQRSQGAFALAVGAGVFAAGAIAAVLVLVVLPRMNDASTSSASLRVPTTLEVQLELRDAPDLARAPDAVKPAAPLAVAAAGVNKGGEAQRPSPPPTAANCSPPFVIDPVTGRKKYKVECLH